jgi:maleate isomerase
MTAATLDLGGLPIELDGGLHAQAAIGLVALATDQTLEHEFRALIRVPDVAFHESGLFDDNAITPETLRAIGPRIAPALDLIPPSLQLDVVGHRNRALILYQHNRITIWRRSEVLSSSRNRMFG